MPEELEKRIEELENVIQSLRATATIPYDIGEAFAGRGSGVLTISTKSASSEDQSVNEAGSASYNVMGDPIGFLRIEIDGATRQIPYFNT